MTATEPLGGFYRGRRVLVTGHTGFKGSWLSSWLLELGAEVFGYALPPPTSPSLFELLRLGGRVTSRLGDIRDFDALHRFFDEAQPEVVFHLAAQPLVRESYRAPRETMEVNVVGTVNVLECVRLGSSVKSVVVVTSDKCYENREWLFGYRENDSLGGHDPYSASKACAELVSAAYRQSFFSRVGTVGSRLGLATARAGNVIGGGDFAVDRLIPDCVRALAARKPVVIRNPAAVRPWQHVLEPSFGYLLLGARLVSSPRASDGPWNFGPTEPEVFTVRQVAESFVSVLGDGALEIAGDDDQPHEAGLLRLSCEKAVGTLGWRPVLATREALAWTVEWYVAWLRKATNDTLRAMVSEQIGRYVDRSGRGSE